MKSEVCIIPKSYHHPRRCRRRSHSSSYRRLLPPNPSRSRPGIVKCCQQTHQGLQNNNKKGSTQLVKQPHSHPFLNILRRIRVRQRIHIRNVIFLAVFVCQLADVRRREVEVLCAWRGGHRAVEDDAFFDSGGGDVEEVWVEGDGVDDGFVT